MDLDNICSANVPRTKEEDSAINVGHLNTIIETAKSKLMSLQTAFIVEKKDISQENVLLTKKVYIEREELVSVVALLDIHSKTVQYEMRQEEKLDLFKIIKDFDIFYCNY